jgi:hypothetical protein
MVPISPLYCLVLIDTWKSSDPEETEMMVNEEVS